MKVALAIVGLGLVLATYGATRLTASNDDPSSTSVNPTRALLATGTTLPRTIIEQQWTDTQTASFEGHPVWYSRSAFLVYADDCNVAERAANSTGQPYSGLGTICLTESTPPTAPPPQHAAYYDNCDAARAAGAAPLHRGDPGYRDALDRDGDGTACEQD